MNNVQKIFIYGVPGTGKTKFSQVIGEKLHLHVIEGDQIKNNTRKGISKSQNPFLYLGTCLAYKEFGELHEENVIKGLLAVRSALRSAVEEEIKQNKKLILEAAFLDPNSVQKFGTVILLTTLNEQKHKKQFLQHREKLLDFAGNEFKAARIVQKYFINEAQKLNIQIIDNNEHIENITQKVLSSPTINL